MHFTLHLTDACNLRCRYCYVRQSTHYMTLDTAKAVVDLAAEDPGHHGLIFFGGEPLLQRQLIYDTVAYAQSLHLPGKFHYKITTNGTLLDREFLDFSQKNQVFIALSHDGIAQDINRIGPEDSGTFDRLEPIAKSLLAVRPYAPVMMTVAPNTVRFYAQGVKYLYELGFCYLICTIDYSGDWQESDFRELERQYRLLAKWYEDLTLREEKFYFSPFEVKISSHIHKSTYCAERCELGKKQLSVAPDGGLYPCVQFVGHPEYQIGDVFRGIDQAKRQKLYAENEETHGPCQECAIQNRCNHHCACLNFQSTGDFHQVSPVLCRHERIVLPIADKLAGRLYQKRSGAFLQKQYNDMYPVISYVEDNVTSKK